MVGNGGEKHLKNDSCPDCNNDMLKFDWGKISDDFFGLFD